MKKILSFVLLATVVLFGCKKNNNGGDQPTEEVAYEIFNHSIQQMEEQWTNVYNATVNNNEYSVLFSGYQPYEDLCENVGFILSGISQTIEIKKTWAEECYASSTLAANLQEILNTFKTDIQEPLEQAKNLFDDGIAEIDPLAPMAEELFLALDDLEQQWTMVYNATVNNEENNTKYGENPEYQELCNNVGALLSGIQQTISTKKIWVEEALKDGTLPEVYEEIYASFEPEIQIPLTQANNVYNDGVAALGGGGIEEELYMALDDLEQQWNMVYNATVNNEENAAKAEAKGKAGMYEEIVFQASINLTAVSQTIVAKQHWIEEAKNAGTLETEAEKISASFEPDIQIPLTQILNVYNQQFAELIGE